MAHQKIDDNSLIESLLEVFRDRGYEGATLSLLSEATGLKKASLYHRFHEGKEDMAKAVVNHVSSQFHDFIIDPLLDKKASSKKRLDQMLTTVRAFYSEGKNNCLLNVLGLDGEKTGVNELLTKDYNAWMNALIQLGLDAGLSEQDAQARSEHLLIVIQGALVVQRLTGNETTFQKNMAFEEKQFFKKIA